MDEEHREPPGRPWLPWALVSAGAAGALWIALLPLDPVLPPPERPERTLDLDQGEEAVAPPPEAAPPAPDAAETTREARPGGAAEEPAPPAPGDWFEETVPPDDPLSVAPPGLRDTIQRQLAMNGMAGVRVEVAGDRIVTSGPLAEPRDRQRMELLLRSLAPELHHEDHTTLLSTRPLP